MIVPKDKKVTIKVVKRFQFSSLLRRMSVIIHVDREGRSHYFAAVKGAPEALHSMLDKCPEDFESIYKRFAREGYRVLALGYRHLKIHNIHEAQHIQRETVECDLIFAGFLLFNCPLKEDSKEAILHLKNSSHFVRSQKGKTLL
jgi:cation-transporting ATPase 13A1